MSGKASEESRDGVALTNLDQPLFDGADATKRDLVDYLDGVRDRIIPELADRPLSVIRVHRGQEAFMQKNVPKYTPEWVRTVQWWAEASKRDVSYALCNDRRTLLWFANQRAVEYHPTLVRADHPDRATHLVLDLDPPDADAFAMAVGAALLVRQALADLGLEGAVKTSGAKGVHVIVPIDAQTPPEDTAAATRAIAARAERLDTSIATTAFMKEDRGGKVFVDSTRVGGATVVAAYSPRARPGVPVSFPVAWEDLEAITPADFTVHTALRQLGDGDPWAARMPPPQTLSADLIGEGHAIPVARVQAMHEGKRRARRPRAREVSAPVDDLLAGSQAALQAGDATTARGLLEPLLEGSPGANVLELMARADYIDLDYQAAIARLERAYAAFRAERDPVGAVRVARTLSYLYMSFVGDFAVGNGWLARAQTLLGAAGETSERGWVALNRGLFEGDRAIKDDHFRTALAVARDHDDAELEVTALAYLGASLVHSDCTAEGMSLLDEALAAVAGREVDDFCVLEEVFCQLFSACERAGDVARADQWIRIGEAIAARRKLPTLLAFCRTHYGGVLTAAGRWAEADETLTAAVRLWGLGRRSGLRLGAFARLADLRVRQGRFEEAEQLLADLDPTAHDAAPAIIAVHLARGETLLARDVAEQALARLDPHSSEAAPLLALLVDVHLATGAVDEAGATAEHLAACARQHGSSHLVAAAALARGRVCAATGTGDPQACFREALAGFRHAQMPMELAQTRLELAAALAGDRPDVARVEARAALDTFEQLHAGRYADAAVALLRSLGVRSSTARQTAGVLTNREVEVLDLVGHGLSNPEIAQRLYISRKTVEHHVGNVLAKLGLRNRAEAVAYVVRAARGS